MKYVKIFDSQMRPLGVLQLGAELAQSEETKYVKVYDENLDKCNGVVALSDNISETDEAKKIKIYDENLNLIGGSTVGEIIDERVTPAFTLSIEPDTIGYEEEAEARITTEMDLTGVIYFYLDNETEPLCDEPAYATDGRAIMYVLGIPVGEHSLRAHFEGDEKYLPVDAYDTFTVTNG